MSALIDNTNSVLHRSEQRTYTVSCAYGLDGIVCFLDGSQLPIINSTYISNPIERIAFLGGRYTGSNKYCGIHSFRVYDRVLTTTEVIHNYNIDRKRFNLL